MVSNIVTFLLGCLAGWFTNHWYSVNMRHPSLRQSGSGGGINFDGSGYRYVSVSLQNELRQLALILPETVIFGKRLKTRFGNQIVERDPARQCRARLLEESGRHICHLWWMDGQKTAETVEIKSGESSNLILFLRSNNTGQYFVYQPTSNTDLTPKTHDVPTFNKTMAFLVEVSYLHGSRRLQFPVKVVIGYDGGFSFETKNSSGMF
jgi:hypothetical protein